MLLQTNQDQTSNSTLILPEYFDSWTKKETCYFISWNKLNYMNQTWPGYIKILKALFNFQLHHSKEMMFKSMTFDSFPFPD